ncbi:MAG: hypothetical protein SGPRY_014710 [Prymnesium sp.]
MNNTRFEPGTRSDVLWQPPGDMIKREMQDAMSAFEQRASEAALPPAAYSRKVRRASKSGSELAALARRQRAPPAATGYSDS